MKRCPKCGEFKSLAEFYTNRSTKDGLTVWCKTCTKGDIVRRRAVGPEKTRDVNPRLAVPPVQYRS